MYYDIFLLNSLMKNFHLRSKIITKCVFSSVITLWFVFLRDGIRIYKRIFEEIKSEVNGDKYFLEGE